MSLNEWVVLYSIWTPVLVGLGIAWFYFNDVFETGRKERPNLVRAIVIAYFVWAWVPFLFAVLT